MPIFISLTLQRNIKTAKRLQNRAVIHWNRFVLSSQPGFPGSNKQMNDASTAYLCIYASHSYPIRMARDKQHHVRRLRKATSGLTTATQGVWRLRLAYPSAGGEAGLLLDCRWLAVGCLAASSDHSGGQSWEQQHGRRPAAARAVAIIVFLAVAHLGVFACAFVLVLRRAAAHDVVVLLDLHTGLVMVGRTSELEIVTFLLEVGARLDPIWQNGTNAAEFIQCLALTDVALERVPGGGQAQEDGQGDGQLHRATADGGRRRTADGCLLLERPAGSDCKTPPP